MRERTSRHWQRLPKLFQILIFLFFLPIFSLLPVAVRVSATPFLPEISARVLPAVTCPTISNAEHSYPREESKSFGYNTPHYNKLFFKLKFLQPNRFLKLCLDK
jgi:hypothetical protein